MRTKNFKGRCTKQQLSKCSDVVRTYDMLQTAVATLLQKDDSILSFFCNVPLDDLEEGEFTTDFLAVKTDGSYLVRECVYRKRLILPRTAKLLDASRTYWERHGVTDWGIIVEKELTDREKE